MTCECVDALCSYRRDIFVMHNLASFHNSKSTRIFLYCKEIHILEWPGYSPDLNPEENVWDIMKKYIGNQMPGKIEAMWKRVCEAWYSVALNIQENFVIQCQGELRILLKQREIQRNIEFMMKSYNVVVFSLECIWSNVVVFFIDIYLICIYNWCLIIRWYDLYT